MDLFVADQPDPKRYPIDLSPRWRAVVLMAPDGAVAVGFFHDGELIYWMDEPLGEA